MNTAFTSPVLPRLAAPHPLGRLTFLLLLLAGAHAIGQTTATPYGHEFTFPANVVPGLRDPRAVALDGQGNAYVADTGNQRIVKFTGDGRFLLAWGAPGATDGSFADPVGIAVDAQGFVYVADNGNNRIQKFTSSGTYVSGWASPRPAAVTTDADNRIYVSDSGVESWRVDFWSVTLEYVAGVRKFTADGTLLLQRAIDTTPFAQPASSGGSGGFASGGLAVDGGRRIFVAYSYAYRNPWSGWGGRWYGAGIEKFAADGTYLKSWGWTPTQSDGLAVDGTGSVYAADAANHRIIKFNGDGATLAEWGTLGTRPGELSGPRGIAVDATGNRVFVADTGNHRIQVFSLRPALQIRPGTNGTLQVTWPAAASGFVLQQTAAVGSRPWTEVTNAVLKVGDEHQVWITPASPGTAMFRLVRP